MNVKVRRLVHRAYLPTYASSCASGADLYALDDGHISGGERLVVHTGIAVSLPPGYEGQVRSRSGLAARGVVVANSPGTIDGDYQGEVLVILANTGRAFFEFLRGDRIAQLVFAPVVRATLVETTEVGPATLRGTGGLGSTGR